MPELPEVETVCTGLNKVMKGRMLARVTLHRKDLRIPFPKSLKSLKDVKIKNVHRRAKYILMPLSDGQTMIVHLGMSGKMTIHGKADKYDRAKHDHMILSLGNGTQIVFNDPRRFGLVDLAKTKEIEQHRFFAHLGPEPFDTAFSVKYLVEKLATKKTSIKIAIMDQRIVVGVGNIYAAEALFLAKINPERVSATLTGVEVKVLHRAIKKTLDKAIEAGGSSLRDYVQADGELGYFQHQWAVYDKEGRACGKCKTDILRITQGGRSTFYCPKCQK